MNTPEFDKEYYDRQIIFMCKRYKKIFSLWKINWSKFYKFASLKLNENSYRVWIFLCGLDTILKDCAFKLDKKEKIKFIQESSKNRIFQIIKEDDKIKFYLKNI